MKVSGDKSAARIVSTTGIVVGVQPVRARMSAAAHRVGFTATYLPKRCLAVFLLPCARCISPTFPNPNGGMLL